MMKTNEDISNAIVNELDMKDDGKAGKSLFLSHKQPCSATWLKSIFSSQSTAIYRKDIELNESDIPIALAIRLLYPIVPSDSQLWCACGKSTNNPTDPYHGLHCNSCSGLIGRRHDRIRDLLAKFSKSVNCQVLKEQTIRNTMINTESRRADLFVTQPSGNMDYIDIAIVDPTSITYRGRNALQVRCGEKRKKYKRVLSEEQSSKFIPFIIESTSGQLHKGAFEFVNKISNYFPEQGRVNAVQNGKRKRFIRDLGLIIMKENCAIVRQFIGTLSDTEPETIQRKPK
jgi:hypothetical protein